MVVNSVMPSFDPNLTFTLIVHFGRDTWLSTEPSVSESVGALPGIALAQRELLLLLLSSSWLLTLVLLLMSLLLLLIMLH